MNVKLMPVVKEMMKFKRFIHGDQVAFFQTFTKNDRLKKKPKTISGKLSTKIGGELVKANNDGMEVAMMINHSNGKARNSSAVTKINAIFVDFDNGNMKLENLLDLPIQPHMIVGTSHKKFHAYWLIKNCPVQQFSSVMKEVALKLGGDSSVCDLARVMRMPGTVNWKYDKPFLARIVHFQKIIEPIPLKKFISGMKLKVDAARQTLEMEAIHQNHGLTDDMVERIQSVLKYFSADDREDWLKVGMAIHNTDQTERGYALWTEWSQKSSKFDETEQRDCWKKFVVGKGVSIKTLFWRTTQTKYGEETTFDEMKLANKFADMCKDELRYDSQNRVWYHYVCGVWETDSQAPVRLVREMIQALGAPEKSAPKHDPVKGFRSASALKGIVIHAEFLNELSINAQDFDRDPHLIAVNNGVIDLRTGQFRAATAVDFLRRQALVEFDVQAKCPEWVAFMKSVTCKDRGLYEYIQRALGYTLFGKADLQIFFLVVGSGSNGKGVLMRTLKNFLGEYAQSVAPNLLVSAFGGNANAPTPALAKLHGARLVICTELPTGRKFDDAFLKQYAGGDEITARYSYGNAFSFKPEGTLWLSTNEVPEIAASDEAMWRRLKPIPFLAEFRGEAVDHGLEEKIAKEYPGILNWLLKGAKSYFENGLGSCSAVDELEAKLRRDSDSLLAWMSVCCVKKASASTQSSLAYESYLSFMRTVGRKSLTTPKFRAGLEKKGFVHKKRSSNNYFDGFHLKKNEPL